MPLAVGVLRWPRSAIELIRDVVILIPNQHMRITSDIDPHSWPIVHVTFDDWIRRKRSVMDIALVGVGIEDDVNVGRRVAMDHIVRNAVQRISRPVILSEIRVKAAIPN